MFGLAAHTLGKEVLPGPVADCPLRCQVRAVAERAGGLAVGWGFQFTQPAFVAGMAWLMLAVALNLLGVFAMGRPVGAGHGLAARGGHVGAFFTGALAVLLATPCTAPFMAAALGAALAMPPVMTMAVFLALGVATTIYVAVALGVFGVLTVDEVIASGGTALAVAAEPVLGQAGFWLMSVTALFATSGATNAGLFPAAGLTVSQGDASLTV